MHMVTYLTTLYLRPYNQIIRMQAMALGTGDVKADNQRILHESAVTILVG